MISRHGQDTQTLHAELMALLLAEESGPGRLAGSFSTKTIAGNEYVYFQYSDPGGGKRQLSLGPASRAVQKFIAEYRSERVARQEDLDRQARLARMLASSGLATTSSGVSRVLRAIGEAGVFRLGGVLVGTHAFSLLGNMLGVQWPPGTWRTEDDDVAARVEIATPLLTADVPETLASLQMGFVPVPAFDPRHASTSFKVRGKQLRVDLLTPGSDRDTAPIPIPRFRTAAAPIKHLSLVMDDAVPAAAVNGGAVLVMVPTPARYALHKLLVSQTRSLVQQTKARKDLWQAALLLEVLVEDRPDDVEQACASFRKSGPVVTAKVLRGARAAARAWSEAKPGLAILERRLR